MPGTVKTDKDEAAWERAKAQVRKQYDLGEDDDRFWALTQSIYGKMTGRESLPTSIVAPMVRASLAKPPAPLPTPDVPLASFADDLEDKVALTQMRDAQARREDETPAAPRMVTKEEAAYRYANVREQSCGSCAHFAQPASCERVIGLIRPVDTCDEWARRAAPITASEAGECMTDEAEMPGTGVFQSPSMATETTWPARTAVQSEAIARHPGARVRPR